MINTTTYIPQKRSKSIEEMVEESRAVIASFERVMDVMHRELYENKRFVADFERSVA